MESGGGGGEVVEARFLSAIYPLCHQGSFAYLPYMYCLCVARILFKALIRSRARARKSVYYPLSTTSTFSARALGYDMSAFDYALSRYVCVSGFKMSARACEWYMDKSGCAFFKCLQAHLHSTRISPDARF